MDPKETIKKNLKRRSKSVDIVHLHKGIPMPTWVELSLIDVCNRKCIFCPKSDSKVAPGGYFDDLASHGLDLFTYFLGNIKEAHGVSNNQQGLYTAKDAISACWKHENGITGMGTWNFGCDSFEDRVEIYGSKGKIRFSIFQENSLFIEVQGKEKEVFIENPKHIQSYHVENMKKHLLTDNYMHPSNGYTACHTSWVMDKILGKL